MKEIIRSAPAWGPLRNGTFALLWTATLISNIGTWTNDVGAGWLMTSLAPSAVMVSLVQAATTLPIFLFALAAGALADIVDRRKMLLVVTMFMMASAAIMGVVVLNNAMTARLLLLFTFLLGTGAAFIAPVWQAVVPKLVTRDELPSAVALGSIGINISRAIGPALGGLLIVTLGVAWPFLINALSFGAVIMALLWWRPAPQTPSHLPAERFWHALRIGLRYARASGPFKITLVRAVAFFPFASAYWALLPLIARQTYSGGPGFYGLLLGSAGAGAVGGAFFLPILKARLGADRMIALGTLTMAGVLVVFALVREPSLAVVASAFAGAAWILVLANLNVAAQVALPEWVRARGLSVFITVFFGAMTLGSVIWGQIATRFDIPTALLVAALGAGLSVIASRAFRIEKNATLDLSAAMHWPEPVVSGSVEPDRGPVMITVQYRIDPQDEVPFLDALYALADARRRDGAFSWGVFEDVAQDGCYLEYFLETSWLEHLRHHERVSEADRVLQERVLDFLCADATAHVSHFLAPGAATVKAPLGKGVLK